MTSTLKFSDDVAAVLTLSYNVAEAMMDLQKRQLLDKFVLTDQYRKQLSRVKAQLNAQFNKIIASKDAPLDDAVALAQAYCHTMSIHLIVDTEEELDVVEQFVKPCEKLLAGRELRSEAFMTVMRARRAVGSLCLKRNMFAQAVSTLEEAVELFRSFKSENRDSPVALQDFMYLKKEEKEVAIYKRLKALIADICGDLNTARCSAESKEQHESKSSIFHRQVFSKLRAALHGAVLTHDEARSCIAPMLDLSRQLLISEHFKEANDCIVSSYFALKKISHEESSQQRAAPCTACHDLIAVIDMHIAKYGLTCLQLRFGSGDNEGVCGTKRAISTKLDSNYVRFLLREIQKFTHDIKETPSLMARGYISDYDSAKEVSADAFARLEQATAITISRLNTLDFINAMLHTVGVHGKLACYESTPETRLHIHLRQQNILDSIISYCKTAGAKNLLGLSLLKRALLASTICELTAESNDQILDEDLGAVYSDEMEKNMTYLAQTSLKYYRQYLQNIE